MSRVEFHNVSKRFGAVTALDGLDLAIESGEFVSLLGPSGSGKSTTLNLLAGLMAADSGRISIGGQDVTELPPNRRDLAMVFQNYALYPHLTVFENIAFPLEARRPKLGSTEIATRVELIAKTLGVADLLARYPREISGGQQQRGALGRAMVRNPKVFLLDEPLSNLDARLRIRMRRDLKELHSAIGSTIVYVTHDQAEAMTLSTRVAVFNHGRLQQFAAPSDIYDNPANNFVMNFVGDRETNFLQGRLAAESAGTRFLGDGFSLLLPRPAGSTVFGGSVDLGIRPEAIEPGNADGVNVVAAEVSQTELVGPELFLYARIGRNVEIGCRCALGSTIVKGQAIRLRFDVTRARLFDSGSGMRVD